MIDDVRIESDEAGFSLVLVGDFVASVQRYLADADADRLVLRLPQDAAIALLAQARSEIGPWAAEMDNAMQEWRCASEEERAEVLGMEPPESGYAPDDPKHSLHVDLLSDATDRQRKIAKGE